MAEQLSVAKQPIEVLFMGDVADAIPPTLTQYCKLLGHKENSEEIEAIYNAAHVIIITSSTEGFPLVIEEGMARGCAVLATPVGDIPVHIKHGENGFLFSNADDEEKIVSEGVQFLTLLCSDFQKLQAISEKNIQYANTHFDITLFNQQYQELLKQPTIIETA
jgi:glycosyltransferase involved in cell wall biosynthesis